MKDLFRNLGFDRLTDLLDTGQYTKIFSSALQNATYAGQAILAVTAIIKELKNCPVVGQAEIQVLEGVKNSFREDELKRQLNSSRIASNNVLARENDLNVKAADIDATCKKATSVVEKCIPGSQKEPDFSQLLSKATGGLINIKLG